MFKSKAQRAKFYVLKSQGKMSQATIDEWEKNTPAKLPERIGPKNKDSKHSSKHWAQYTKATGNKKPHMKKTAMGHFKDGFEKTAYTEELIKNLSNAADKITGSHPPPIVKTVILDHLHRAAGLLGSYTASKSPGHLDMMKGKWRSFAKTVIDRAKEHARG